ncbi:MAG: dienelactone hydrolase family protein [Woeseiaceae bacterium]|nr:dienelactone hydrolase family protein [Woeseiaceae bacterium]
MAIQHRLIDYYDGDVLLEGRLSYDDSVAGPRPGILVSHTIAGRGPLEESKAGRLAEQGYAAFALDLYGKHARGKTLDENRALMNGQLDDRPAMQHRLRISLDTMRAQPEVDDSRTGAIGFCFGGLCVLDIARTGEDIAGVVSFHGLFGPPGNTTGNRIRARVLVLHGWDDPMVTPDSVNSLAAEMSAMGADWQLHAYGNTKHAFTNPVANDHVRGTVYNEDADRRSWQAMTNFFAELFGGP